jgi:hypothetical protein
VVERGALAAGFIAQVLVGSSYAGKECNALYRDLKDNRFEIESSRVEKPAERAHAAGLGGRSRASPRASPPWASPQHHRSLD